MRVYNRHEEKEKRQTLRRERPPAEVILWQRLRGEQIGGFKFRRQYSVGAYVLDFYCPRCKLAIEIDGPTHEGDEVALYDANRQAAIESHGIRFLRFTNEQVYHQLNTVVEAIANALENDKENPGPPNPIPGPLSGRGFLSRAEETGRKLRFCHSDGALATEESPCGGQKSGGFFSR